MISDRLKEFASEIENEYVRKARAGGQKIIGYACLSTPREVFDAAGLFPYRLKAFGRAETEMADAYLSRFNCGFCRACLQLGIDGSYDFLDGLIETNGCDHLRGMFENWQYAVPRQFFHYIKVPHLVDQESLQWFSEEITLLIDALEDHFAVSIDPGKLHSAMQLQDQIAANLREIYRERRGPEIRVTGAEIISLILAEGSLPAAEYLQLLDDLTIEIKRREPLDCRARLFIGGSATDEVELIASLEQLGALAVADSFCFGGRAFLRAASSEDPVNRLAEIYLNNLLCPRMFMNYENRKSYIFEQIRLAGCEGAVFFHNKFCDLHGIENVKLKMDLEKEGFPVLLLEKEYGAGADIGRMKTRLQAFLEQLRR